MELTLKNKELFDLLWLFRGQYVTIDRAMDWMYGAELDPPYDNNIRVRVCLLKKKLRGYPVHITVQWTRGYTLEIDKGLAISDKALYRSIVTDGKDRPGEGKGIMAVVSGTLHPRKCLLPAAKHPSTTRRLQTGETKWQRFLAA